MRKIYLKILIGIIVLLWGIYFIQSFTQYEGFTPKIRGLYRPYIRNMNQHIEHFTTNYGLDSIINKFRKWNIY